MKLQNKSVLVTGGIGFIGSHIVDALVKRGCKVTVIDDFSKGSINNLQWAKENGEVKIVKGSVENFDLMERLLEDCSVIFHEAALNLLLSNQNPIKDLLVNTLGLLNILEVARELGTIDMIVYASSGSVYGEPIYNPQDEEHPLNPTSPYGISKLAAEKYVLLWHKMFDVNTVALRYYNVYGPRQDYGETGGVIPIFIKRVIRDEPPIIEGDGTQERCFTHVSDVVNANIQAAENEKAGGDVFNIGTEEVTTIEDLAHLIIELEGKDLNPEYTAPRMGDVRIFRPDITKAKKILDYYPKTTLTQGLPSVIEWMKEKLYEKM